MSKKSYRSMKKAPEINRFQTFTKGWYRSIAEKISQLKNDVEGLNARVNSVRSNKYKEFQNNKGIPASYRRDFFIGPEDTITNFDPYARAARSNYAFPNNTVPLNPPDFQFNTSYPFNFILKSGNNYSVDIQMSGDGVFVASQISVQLYFRLFVPGQGIMNIPMSQVDSNLEVFDDDDYRNTQRLGIAVANTRPLVASNRVHYFWNLIDRSSGRRYSDHPLPSYFMTPQSELFVDTPKDGDAFKFNVPWTFERDSQLEFEFKPITDFFQVDPSSAILPHGFDDREQNQTSRNNGVTIRIELHGEKYLNMQDAMKYGAKFWQRDDSLAFGPGGTIVDENNYPGQ